MPSDFNPANGLIRSAWEPSIEGLPQEANWFDFTFVKESLTGNYEKIDDPSISSNAQRPRRLPSKITAAGAIDVALNNEGHAHFLAQIQGKSAAVTDLTGAYRHKLAPSETSITFPKTRSIEVWRDDDMGHVFKGCRVNDWKLDIAERSVIRSTFGIAGLRSDYADAGSISGGGTAKMFARGLPNYANWTATDGDTYIKVTDVTNIADMSDPRVVAKVKQGAASSYGSDATITLRIGAASQANAGWIELFDSNGGARLGTRALPYEVYLTGVLTSITTSTVFRVDRERNVWVASLPAVEPFNEIYCLLNIDSADYVLDTLSFNITTPTRVKFGPGGRYAKRVLRRGRRAVGGSFKRDHIDNYIRKKLEAAQSFQLYIYMTTGTLIGATAYEQTTEIHALTCEMDGPTPSIESETDSSENMTFTCHPGSDGTYPDDATIVVTNSIASLAT